MPAYSKSTIHRGHAETVGRLWLIILLLAVTNSAFAGSFTHTVKFDPSNLSSHEVCAPDGNTYLSFDWPGLSRLSEAGLPDFPVKYVRFLIPTFCNNVGVSLSESIVEKVEDCAFEPLPIQEQLPTNIKDTPGFTKGVADKYSGEDFTHYMAIVDESFLDGYWHVITVAVCPLAYAGKKRKLQVCRDMAFTISFTDCKETDMEVRPVFPRNNSSFFSLDSSILDPLNLRTNVGADTKAASPSVLTQQDNNYYIITPASLKTALSDFVLWKRQKGYNVVVKTIEEILATEKYKVNKTHNNVKLVDKAASLRAYLTDEFKDRGFFHCLLVGNSQTSMPIRKVWRSKSKYDTSEGLTPTDLYFIDLISEWSLTIKSGLSIYTGNVPSIFNPCISVGRLLCTSAQEIENWTRKVRLYEANPGYGDNDYLGKALFIEQWSWNYDKERENSLLGDSEKVSNFLSSYLECETVQDPHKKASNTYGISGTEAIKKMSAVGLHSWHGHGNPISWGCAFGRFVTSEDSVWFSLRKVTSGFLEETGNGIDNMSNHTKPNIAYSISCDNTPFDIMINEADETKANSKEVVWDARYNLGEAFTVGAKGGGPVFLGNTRVGYITSSADMELEFFKGLAQNRNIGYAQNYSKSNYSSSHLRATHSIIGDPEIDMWLGKPQTLDITFDRMLTGLSLKGTGVNNSILSFYDGEGHCVSYKSTPPTQSVAITEFPTNFDTDTYMISVWKPDFLPEIRLWGQNASLTNRSKEFIVREAIFGSNVTTAKMTGDYTVSNNGKIVVKALDRIQTERGFIVGSGGTVTFICDNGVSLQESSVNSGGRLEITAASTVLENGFSVAAGGILEIRPN